MKWLVLVACLGGCECKAKRREAPVASEDPRMPKIGDTKPVPLDAPEADAAPPDAPPSPAEQAFLTRRTFFGKLARDAKIAGEDCARLADLVRANAREAHTIAELGRSVSAERAAADRAALDGAVKMLTLAKCDDNTAVTKFLDELAR